MLLDMSKPEDYIIAAALRGPDKNYTVGVVLKKALTAPLRSLVGVPDDAPLQVGYHFWRGPQAPEIIVAMLVDISKGAYRHYLDHLSLAYEELERRTPGALVRCLRDLVRVLGFASAGNSPDPWLVLNHYCAAVIEAVRGLDGDQPS